jgi:hypothetical protein
LDLRVKQEDDITHIAIVTLLFLKGGTMGTDPKKSKIDPEKMQALRSLPLEIKQSLTKEEVNAFLNDEVWPDSLRDKLKDYLVDET